MWITVIITGLIVAELIGMRYFSLPISNDSDNF